MRLPFGFELRKAARPLSGVDDSRGWTQLFDWKAGAWQQHAGVEVTDVFAQSTVFACITLIASDIGKLRLGLVEKRGRIWVPSDSPAYSPVLRKPNHFQTRQKFIEGWIASKLMEGNTYVLKERDNRKVVKALYVLDPKRCKPLVAPDGTVYYQLGEDDLNQLPTGIEAIPASEIIHDRMVCLFHPLVGVTPMYAANLPALQALKIQQKSKDFFANQSRPGGIITAPGKISEETAKRIKDHWERNYTGENAGRVAVLGDALAYTAGSVNAVDSQLVEQLKITAPQICSVFHVPPFMVGAADAPPYGNIGPAVQQYYNQCLQSLIESFEASMDDGLGIGEGVNVEGRTLGAELNLDDLLRMDGKTLAEVEVIKTGGGIASPDEAREKFNLGPVDGGSSPMLQQQNYSLAALAKRDAQQDPFATATPAAPATPANDEAVERVEEAADKAAAKIDAAVGQVASQAAQLTDLVNGIRAEQQARDAEAARQKAAAEEEAACVAEASAQALRAVEKAMADGVASVSSQVVSQAAMVDNLIKELRQKADAEKEPDLSPLKSLIARFEDEPAHEAA
jgi:HK97 family phage portal protein